jgi:hypothetical protein
MPKANYFTNFSNIESCAIKIKKLGYSAEQVKQEVKKYTEVSQRVKSVNLHKQSCEDIIVLETYGGGLKKAYEQYNADKKLSKNGAAESANANERVQKVSKYIADNEPEYLKIVYNTEDAKQAETQYDDDSKYLKQPPLSKEQIEAITYLNEYGVRGLQYSLIERMCNTDCEDNQYFYAELIKNLQTIGVKEEKIDEIKDYVIALHQIDNLCKKFLKNQASMTSSEINFIKDTQKSIRSIDFSKSVEEKFKIIETKISERESKQNGILESFCRMCSDIFNTLRAKISGSKKEVNSSQEDREAISKKTTPDYKSRLTMMKNELDKAKQSKTKPDQDKAEASESLTRPRGVNP